MKLYLWDEDTLVVYLRMMMVLMVKMMDLMDLQYVLLQHSRTAAL